MDDLVSKEMVQKYLERKRTQAAECETAFARGDLKFIESFGHQMKGNGESFGFPYLTTLGSEIEVAGKEQDPDKIRVLLKKLKVFLEEQN